MKPSHFTTPRSLDEGSWDHNGQALHHFPDPAQHSWDDIAIACIGVFVVLGIAWGWL